MPLSKLTIKSAVLLMVAALVLSLAACGKGGGGGNSLHVKSTAGEKDVPLKSSYAFAVTKTFTDITGKISTAPTYRAYAASYDLDASFFAKTLDKPLTADDQVRVEFSLVGEQGGTEATAVKAGAYSAKADKFMKVEDIAIVTRKGGQDNKQLFDRSKQTGEVRVTSVSDDSFSGDVDLASGDTSIKGSFTAKILKRK